MKCHQAGCEKPAIYRYTWPGKNEETICAGHGEQITFMADAIGMPIQLIPLTLTNEELYDDKSNHA